MATEGVFLGLGHSMAATAHEGCISFRPRAGLVQELQSMLQQMRSSARRGAPPSSMECKDSATLDSSGKSARLPSARFGRGSTWTSRHGILTSHSCVRWIATG